MNLNLDADTLKKMVGFVPVAVARTTPVTHWLSGDAAFVALKQAVEELAGTAPKNCDVLIRAFDLSVREVKYIKPHTFLFRGITDNGDDAWVVCHFTQLVAHVVYLPKRGRSRVITGFSNGTV